MCELAEYTRDYLIGFYFSLYFEITRVNLFISLQRDLMTRS